MDKAQLASRIKETAYLEGEFTLRSGAKSNYYLDKYLFATQPDILAELGRRLAERAADADVIAGPELGAVALAAATAMAAEKPYVIVRNAKKGYGTGKVIEGKLPDGAKVLLVEDIVTSGGQVVEAIGNLRDAGAEVVKAVCVIDRLADGARNIASTGVEYEALLTVADLGVQP
jgi:orotate phosphoribosyltransferase